MTTTPDGGTERRIPDDVVNALGAMRVPIMISHVVPDADALGSMFAMARSLASDQCRAKVSLPAGSLSKRLSFMFDWAEVAVATGNDFSSADGFIALGYRQETSLQYRKGGQGNGLVGRQNAYQYRPPCHEHGIRDDELDRRRCE